MPNPDQDTEGLFADAGDASVLVYDGGPFYDATTTTAPGEQEDEQTMERKNKKQRNQIVRRVRQKIAVWRFGCKPQSYPEVDLSTFTCPLWMR